MGKYLKLAQSWKLPKGKIDVLQILRKAQRCITRSISTFRTGWWDLVLSNLSADVIEMRGQEHTSSWVNVFPSSLKINRGDSDHQYLVSFKEPTQI